MCNWLGPHGTFSAMVPGDTVTQSLRVDLDPRVRVADTTLTAQLRLALDIASALADEWTLADSLHAASAALKSAVGRTRDRQLPEDGSRLPGIGEDGDDEPEGGG